MPSKIVTTIFTILVAFVASGCNAPRTLNADGISTPRADIPNVGEALTATAPVEVTGAVDTTTVRSGALAPPQNETRSVGQTATNTASLSAQPSATLSFTPIIGAPVTAVQPLSRQLGTVARARGLTIVKSTNSDGGHILKGYFSAFADGDKTTIAFVWDVLDSQGNRLHRIRGQEVIQGTAIDPWNAIEATTMESIGTRTIEEYLFWRTSLS